VVAIYPISSTAPYFLSKEPVTHQLHGSGPNKARQDNSHAHDAVIHGEELLVSDLGADKTWRFTKDDSGAWKPSGFIQYEPGDGPRHLAIRDGVVYTILELKSAVAAHRLTSLQEEATLVARAPTVSPPAHEGMVAAEILIPPPNATYPTPYAYVSNRDDPSPEGDTIGILSIEKPEELALVDEVRTGLNHVRSMAFGGHDNRYLVVGGVNGGGVKVYERVDGGQGLKEVASNAGIKKPTNFIWV